MTALISFTGPQSSGKTTLLDKCKEMLQGKWYYIDEVTRWVKRKYNININEEGTNIDQMLMLNRHISNAMLPVSKRNEGYDGIILNRCLLDSVVYSDWLYSKDKIDRWMFIYGRQALKELQNKYDIIYYTDPNIPLEDDGVRSTNEGFRTMISGLFEEYMDEYELPIVRLEGSVEDRMCTMLDSINEHLTKN
jgi:nicotinamide riboside kinase